MEKTYTGVDIGDHALKFAVSNGASIKTMVSEAIPDGMIAAGRVVSFDAMSEFIREVASRHKGLDRNVAFVIPTGSCITRRMRVPAMSEKDLALNLPFEFRDYIIQGKDKYAYDYAVLSIEKGEDGKPVSLDLLAVAAPKEVLSDFTEMFKRAGFKLRRALPPLAALQNLMMKNTEAAANCCVIDFSHAVTQLHYFAHGTYDVTRTIDIGGRDITLAIAAQFGIDQHMAGEYKHTNFNSAQIIERSLQIYESIAVEAGRAMNFYSFNNPEVSIDVAYYCGGGSKIPALVDAVTRHIGVSLQSIEQVMPVYAGGDDQRTLCPLAVGATMA